MLKQTKGNKIFVVISDALRYEVGEELLRLIRQEDRYDASRSPGDFTSISNRKAAPG